MNPSNERTILEQTRRNPFWVCLFVFALLAADYGLSLSKLVKQRGQLDQFKMTQAVNIGRMSQLLAQQGQLEAKLQNLSMDLIELAKTDDAARQVVREFNIQWNPGAGAAPVNTNTAAKPNAPPAK